MTRISGNRAMSYIYREGEDSVDVVSRGDHEDYYLRDRGTFYCRFCGQWKPQKQSAGVAWLSEDDIKAGISHPICIQCWMRDELEVK